MTLGLPGRLFVVRVPHRGEHALDADAARIVVAGVRQVAAVGSGAGAGELAVLLDPTGLPGIADDLGEGIDIVLPLSTEDADFRLEADHGFGSQLEAAGADIAHVEVRWASDHDPGAKKAQAVELTRLAAWVHETGRALLVELAVPGLAATTGDDRTDELVHTVREVREVGMEADLWAVPGPLDADTIEALDELVRDAGRENVGLLVTDGRDVGRGDASAPVPGLTGFVLGPAIWSDPLTRWRAGELDDAAAGTEIAERLRQQIAATGGAPGA